MRCFGENEYGQLGGNAGDSTFQPTPVEVGGLHDVLAIESGAYHTCAVLENGDVSCWGQNTFAQLGNGDDTLQNTAVPGRVLGISHPQSLAVGRDFGCVLLGDRSVRCWGKNDQGRLGIGLEIPSTSLQPLDVVGLPYE